MKTEKWKGGERREAAGGGVLDESETCTPVSTKALCESWTIEASSLQFTGLPRSVYFVSVLMEWSRFRMVAGQRFPFSRR